MKKKRDLSSDSSDENGMDCKMVADNINMGVHKKVGQKGCKVKGAVALTPLGTDDLSSSEDSPEKQHPSGSVQQMILKELKCVDDRLDVVEEEMHVRRNKNKQKPSGKLSNHLSKKDKQYKHKNIVHSESSDSSDSDHLPALSVLRSSKDI